MHSARQHYGLGIAMLFLLCGGIYLSEVQAALGDNHLLIITPAEFEDTLQPLVDLKRATGLTVTLVTLEEIHALWSPGDPGDATPEEIKRSIELLERTTSGIGYVMLVGDVNKFPVRWQLGHLGDNQVEVPATVNEQYFVPTDFYYADLYPASPGKSYNDWDADGDGYYGEIYETDLNPDGMDFFPDVAVARIPVSNENQLVHYVGKVIRYEFNNDTSDWFDRALLIQKGWSSSIHITENIASHFEGHTFDITRLYDDIDDSYYDGPIDGEPISSNISAGINVGAGFVSHLSHGDAERWQGPEGEPAMFDISDIQTDLNRRNRLPVIFSGGCLTAKIFSTSAIPHCNYQDVDGNDQLPMEIGDATPPEPAALQPKFNEMSIGEAFLVENDFGAVAYYGSQNTGQPSPPEWREFAHKYLEQSFFTNWRPEDNILGDMWANAVTLFATANNLATLTPSGWRETCKVHTPSRFILLGDPSLRVGGVQDLLDKVPATLSDDYDGLWHNERVYFTLTASDEGSPPLYISSGIEKISHTIDGGRPRIRKNVDIFAPDSHTWDGIHVVESWADDYCRNSPTPHVTEVKIDTVKPVTEIELGGSYPATVVCPPDSGGGFTCPERGCYDEEVTVTLTPRDDDSYTSDISGVSSTGYNYDGWPFEPYSAPFMVSGFCGSHVEHLDYFSNDSAGNREDINQESFCITSDSCWADMGIMWENVRFLAAMEEIIALRMRDDFASTLPPIESVKYEYALEEPNPNWMLINTDLDGQDGWGVEWNTAGVQNGRYRIRLTVMSNGQTIFQEELRTLVSNLSSNSYLFQHSGPNEVSGGDLVSYEIVFENKSGSPIYAPELVCDLEPGNFNQITVQDNGYLDQYGRPAWNRNMVDPGEQWVVHFTAQTKTELIPGTIITSQASLSAVDLPQLISDDPATQDARDYTAVRIKDKNGTISGTVQHYKYGTPIQADIVLTGEEAGQTTSDEQGQFSFTGLKPGTYAVGVSAEGYIYHVPAAPITVTVNNQGDGYQADFFLARQDARAPRSRFALTADEIVKQGVTVLAGTASDYEQPGSGLEKVEICIRRNNDGYFWNGKTWSAAEIWLPADGTENWSWSFGSSIWNSPLSYTLKSRATDMSGNVEKSRGQSTTPQAPKLLLPTDKMNIYNLRPAFDWEDLPDCKYILQVDNNSDFLTPEIHKPYYHETSNYTPPVPLAAGIYYWRVQAVSNSSAPASAWSDVWQVTVFSMVDKDQDGIDDNWEIFYFGNTTTCNAHSDYDGDGYSDLQEFLNQQNGEKDPLGNLYDPRKGNAPGGTGYTRSSGFWLLMRPALLHNDFGR